MFKELLKYSSILLVMISLMAFGPQQDSTAVDQKAGKIKIEARNYQDMSVEMADVWRQNGKIYVVVATISTLLVGFFVYLFLTERKIARLEQELKEN